jgi:NADH-quinone oxidoreductase subunit L
MSPTTTSLWYIPLFPLAGAAVNLFLGPRLGKGFVKAVGCGAVLGAFVFAVLGFLRLQELAAVAHGGAAPALTASLGDWIAVGNVRAALGLLADPLSAVMALVVTGVGFLIHLYSTAYMAGDARFSRYFAYLNLFTAAMLLLILGDNLLLMFLGWEGVGLCSCLLIGFWFEETKNAVAGMKAFVVNRVGDYGFTIGMLLLFVTVGAVTGRWAVDFVSLREALAAGADTLGRGEPRTLLAIAGILLFVGACGKSAQIPLYVWLPDAMAGPTPVSALIHAATMVTAGVYMVARLNAVYQLAPLAGEVVAVVGTLTALFAATIALVQTDIKKVLAYSTVSQLGFMFLGVGVGASNPAGFSAGIFHVVTHAFFKACLFLGAGSVIHAMHAALPHAADPQDIRNMGGLRHRMPVTAWTFLVATLAIAGCPPLAGFFSKDEILWLAFRTGHPVLWSLAAITAGLTAFYMIRLLLLTFFGAYRGNGPSLVLRPLTPPPVFADAGGHAPEAAHGHASADAHATDARHDAGHDAPAPALPHESPAAMTAPLVVLAALAAVAGFLGLPAVIGTNRFEHWMEPVFAGFHEAETAAHGLLSEHAWEWLLMGASVAVAATGALTAVVFYVLRPDLPGRLATAAAGAYETLRNKYYVDEFYQAAIVRPLLAFERLCARFDLGVIDGCVNGFARFWHGTSDYSGWVDATLVDGTVNGTAEAVAAAGRQAQRLQTGRLRGYLAYSLAGALALVLGYHLWAARGALLAWAQRLLTL